MEKIVNHNGIAFGEGLAHAAQLECGKSPFVYVDERFINLVKPYPLSHSLDTNLIIDNTHQEKYFNFLQFANDGHLGKQERNDTYSEIDQHIRIINKNLAANKSHERNYLKWAQLGEFYNLEISRINERVSQIYGTEEVYNRTKPQIDI